MLEFGLLAFTQPWLLACLAVLPALWLLLRITPPAPRRQLFPALRLLLRLDPREETPARTPLWLLLMRIAIAALLITALAGPVLNPQPRVPGSGPMLLVVDDGWASAADWPRRVQQIDALLTQAERDGRPVHVLRTAPDPVGRMVVQRSAAITLREELPGWQPKPWPVDRAAARALLGEEAAGVSTLWLSDGVTGSASARRDAEALARRLRELGELKVLAVPATELAAIVRPPELGEGGLAVEAVRAMPGVAATQSVRALGAGGEVLGRADLAFLPDSRTARGILALPLDLQNRVARIELQPSVGIGGVALLDERWRRRTVGIVAEQEVADQPLLSEVYFLQRALAPFATVRIGTIETLTETPLSMLILPDIAQIGEAGREQLLAWIEKGGVLLRFAGPRLASGTDDPLVPVPLRAGDRQLGGVLSWSEPLPIARFDPKGPFAGLKLNEEAKISRQILAEPGPELAAATFASLADGTPLVTGRGRGQGWLVLIHTTANTTWSSLPLSGLFVDMLRRLLALAPGAGGQPTGNLVVAAVLDAYGSLQEAPPGLAPVPATRFAELTPGPAYPPGLYAPANSGDQAEIARQALNLQTGVPDLQPLAPEAYGASVEDFSDGREIDLAPWLLLAALILGLIDLIIAYALRGLIPRMGAARALGGTAVLAGLFIARSALAQEAMDPRSVDATLETRLAFVLTGDTRVDEMSRSGLEGLGRVLGMRTSVETGEPVGVDIASDDLNVYPILYWPIPPDHPDVGSDTLRRIETYLRRGGMILFDTGDAAVLLPGQDGGGPGEHRLSEILRGIDLPPLARMPPDHVLTRSFYLLQEFPGRWTGQPVWVDQVPTSINDGVSSVIIGANDWAGAWAVDGYGQSLLPVVPGGEAQREMARRFGVNLVMYALTGNYKTDQVHVPALLERLGQ